MLLVMFGSAGLFADTIVLKSGREVDVEMAWIEDGQVKGVLSGVEMTYPRSAVERIDQERSETDVDAGNSPAGFRFGLWISGMHLTDVRQLAETHGIELSAGRMAGRKRYFAAHDSRFAEIEGIRCHYAENLLEKPAEVELKFTPASEKLYGLTVRWMEPEPAAESDFFTTVYSNLSQKYGRPDQKEAKLLLVEYGWKIDEQGWVNLVSGDGAVIIRYLDATLEEVARAEHRMQGRSVDSPGHAP
jgi:hypothetical protein